MSYATVAKALASLFIAVPTVVTVEREEQLPLGKPRGSVVPEPASCPLVRLSVSRRLRSQERGWLLDGTRDAQSGVQCDVWAYAPDPVAGADSFLALVDALQSAVRQRRRLAGQADTPTSKLLDIRPVDGPQLPRTLSQDGKAVLHATFTLLCREAVN